MISVFLVLLITIGCVMFSMRWIYPRPPKGYIVPKAGDNLTPRQCNFCGHTLAEWRGIVDGEHFFCNHEHQADFLAGKTYQIAQEKIN